MSMIMILGGLSVALDCELQQETRKNTTTTFESNIIATPCAQYATFCTSCVLKHAEFVYSLTSCFHFRNIRFFRCANFAKVETQQKQNGRLCGSNSEGSKTFLR
jgi:hypothetical protein